MSILLDALRKSEQEKKLGAAPDIHGAEPMIYETRRPGWLIPVGVAGLVLLLLVGTYLAWRTFLPIGQEPPGVDVNSVAGTSPQQAAQGQAVTREAPAAESGQAAARPLNPAAVETGEANAASASSDNGEKPVSRRDTQPRSPVESLTGDRPFQAAAGAAASTAAADTSMGSTVSTSTPPVAATSGPGTTSDSLSGRLPLPFPDADSSAEPDSSELASEPSTGDTRDDNGVISYWQLPETVRNQLPPFKITVLVYDEVPANRFILMGGKRYQVGDMYGSNVRLLTILRDRAIFRYGAYRFFVTQR